MHFDAHMSLHARCILRRAGLCRVSWTNIYGRDSMRPPEVTDRLNKQGTDYEYTLK